MNLNSVLMSRNCSMEVLSVFGAKGVIPCASGYVSCPGSRSVISVRMILGRLKRLSLPLFFLLCLNNIQAQQMAGIEGVRMAPRANVVTYENENDIERLKYASSPFITFLDEDWTRAVVDEHVVLSQHYFIPKDWKDFRVFFQMKAPAGYGLFVGDKFIGESQDGSALTEFDLSEQLRFGKSVELSLRYVGHDGALLEEFPRNNDQEPLPGECSFLLKPLLNVQDYTVTTEYEAASQMGSYTVDFDLFNIKKKGKCYVEVEIWDPQGHQVDKLGKWCFFDKRSETSQSITSSLSKVQSWNAEVPRLYTLVIRLYDEKMREQDLVGTRFGFLSVKEQNRFSLNGKALTIKGVAISQLPTRNGGNVLDEKILRNEMMQMKVNNINALRYCGNDPLPERFFELCDELGFYVICDAYLSPKSNMGQAVATDIEYRDLFADRVRSMYGRLKNHPCILAWSLGNSPDNGICMQSAYQALKQLDSQRPVLYTGAQYSENTDIIAPMFCNIDMLSQYLAKNQSRSLIMLSYGDVQGNSFGGMQPLWQKVYDQESIQGGFLNCYKWSSVMDLPYLPEIKQLYRPFDVKLTSVSPDAAEFLITNLCDFRTLADYRLEYVIYTNLKSDIVSGDVPMALSPGEAKDFKLKVPQLNLYTGEELFIKFVLRQRSNTPTIPKNTELCFAQFALPSTNADRYNYSDQQGSAFNIENDTAGIVHISNNNISLQFDKNTGLISDVDFHGHRVINQPPSLSFMRAPSENDLADPNGLKQWMRYGVAQNDIEIVATNCKKVDPYTVGIDVMTRYNSPSFGVLFDVRQSYMILSSGDILINNDVTVSEQIKSLARVGLQMGVTRDFDTIELFGRSIESYSDRKSAGKVVQQKIPVSQMVAHYNDNLLRHEGNHVDTRWAALRNSTIGLYVDIIDTLCNFSIDEFGDDLKTSAIMDGSAKIQKADNWILHVDYAMAGVGGAQAGMNLAERDLVKSHKYNFTVHLRPYECQESNAQDFRRIIYPKVVSNITELPVIRKNRERFDGPMQVTITCNTPKAEIRYTLDGTVPTEKSPLYTKPITIQNSVVLKARAFKTGEAPSFVATEQFSFDYVVSCQFGHKPNTPYNKNAVKALFDGEIGDVNDLSRGWLGFSGHDVQVDLELSKCINIKGVTLRFAHVPDAWVFAPSQVMVAVSKDGKEYSDYVPATVNYDAAAAEMNTTQLQVIHIPVSRADVRFVRLLAKPISRIPQWHRAKGLKPWTMMDEVVIEEEVIK